MAGSVSQINSLSTQIATAAEQQSAVTEEINRSMVQIRHMVEELVDGGLTAGLVLPVVLRSHCGSELARDGRGSASMDVEWADAFASKLAHRTLFALAT
ncbi:hypothetical protein BSF43_27460 [Pseudomonas ogarae]|nr:hypothetical protein BSF43_27460 [Pseudomonas ogarae]